MLAILPYAVILSEASLPPLRMTEGAKVERAKER